jgi:hypothetical protein
MAGREHATQLSFGGGGPGGARPHTAKLDRLVSPSVFTQG